MTDLIQIRRGTSAEWAAANPVLAVAEPGLDTTTGTFKLGDGATAWSALAVPAASSSTPRGFVAQAFVTTDQTAIGAGPSNMSNYDVNFTAVANRRYKFTSAVLLVASATPSVWAVDLLDGATNLGRMVVLIDQTQGQRTFSTMVTNSALSAGSHTMHMSISRISGSGTCDNIVNTQKGFLLVEDIGA